jgi:hypothetical protein
MPNRAVERGPSDQGRSTSQLPDSLRWVLLLLLPPVPLASLEIVNPQPQMNLQAIMDGST